MPAEFDSSQNMNPGCHPAAVDVERPQGVVGLRPALGGGTRVEEELAVHARIVPWDVAVAEHDDVGLGELAPHPAGPSGARPAVVDHGDADALDLQGTGLG